MCRPKNRFFGKLEITIHKCTLYQLTAAYLFAYIYFYNNNRASYNWLLIMLTCFNVIYKRLYNSKIVYWNNSNWRNIINLIKYLENGLYKYLNGGKQVLMSFVEGSWKPFIFFINTQVLSSQILIFIRLYFTANIFTINKTFASKNK